MSDLRGLFNPKSIALVGATDKSGWSLSTYNNLLNFGFPGEIYLVNPKGAMVHERQAFRSLSDIPGPVELAYVMVPINVVMSVLKEGCSLGVRNYVILTSGYGEVGAEGKAKEDEIATFARDNGLNVLGPNGNGFINAAASNTPYGLPIPPPLLKGSVGVVLQSGALASSVLAFSQSRNIGISLLTAMGNEAVVSVTDVIDNLVDDPDTKVIALFLEAVRQPGEFARVARKALKAGKPIVALKVGRSELASQTAQAHTGALVGDDKTVDAAFSQLGVIRVRSLEDLIITAGLLADTGLLAGNSIGVVTPSGGASEVIADRAQDEGLELPEYGAETAVALKEILPDFATVNNPLDVTGYVVVDRTLLGRALEVAAKDPGVDAILLLTDIPRQPPPDEALAIEALKLTAQRILDAPIPVVVMSNALTDVTAVGRALQDASGFPHVTGGIEHGISALGAAVRWSDAYRRDQQPAEPIPTIEPVVSVTEERRGIWGERQAAQVLADNGISVVPSVVVSSADEAAEAAMACGFPVVLKAAVDGLGHKSDIGGVRLGLGDETAVRKAFDDIGAALSVAGIEGGQVLVQPQRSGGTELLVGIVRDEAWGPTLAVGLGGIWVEVMKDTALRVLPVGPAEVRKALMDLRGIDMLRGARGTEPADLDVVADVVARVAALAVGLGDDLESLEINPLLVQGSRVEALDALISWRS